MKYQINKADYYYLKSNLIMLYFFKKYIMKLKIFYKIYIKCPFENLKFDCVRFANQKSLQI